MVLAITLSFLFNESNFMFQSDLSKRVSDTLEIIFQAWSNLGEQVDLEEDKDL